MINEQKETHIETRKKQKGATKLIPSLSELSYAERLQILGFTTLEQRRERGDLIAVYRVLKGREKLVWENLLVWDTSGSRGYKKKLRKITAGEISKSLAFHKDA